MAQANTNVSIVDYLNSTGKASDYNTRANLAKANGIANYTGTAAQNTSLLATLKKAATPAPVAKPYTPPSGYTKVPNVAALPNYTNTVKDPNSVNIYGVQKTPTNVNEANANINAGQQADFNSKAKADEPATRNSVQNYNDIYNQITTSLTKDLPDKPAPVNLADTYKKLKTDAGVTDLETNLADLNKQARDIQAISAERTRQERDKPVAMNVIAGRITEEQAQDNIRLQAVNDSIKTVSDQLAIKYNAIDSIMKYTGADYDNAVKNYDSQFSQNISTMNMVKGMVDTQASQEEVKNDNARANLQIIYNSMKANNTDPNTIDPAQKANILKLELQAGLPQGFYQNVVEKNPKADILSTTTRENGTQKYADIILRDQDGKITTKSIYLGAAANQYAPGSGTKKETKPTEAETKRTAVSNMGKDLQSLTGGDGYVSPSDYKKGKQLWISAGRDSKEYDDAFKGYVNPTQYYELGLQ